MNYLIIFLAINKLSELFNKCIILSLKLNLKSLQLDKHCNIRIHITCDFIITNPVNPKKIIHNFLNYYIFNVLKL